ncbi:MAG: hypothetical protein PHY45_11225 [Rhodocyclaceae bacterium]|nr:hypothetical protein [Rhodocyclaceae bacterium]
MLMIATTSIYAFTARQPPAIDMASIVAVPDRGTGLQIPGKRSRVKCAECGVVASTREIGTSAVAQPIREVTVRMRDGSERIFVAANSVRWRRGERMVLIEDASRTAD